MLYVKYIKRTSTVITVCSFGKQHESMQGETFVLRGQMAQDNTNVTYTQCIYDSKRLLHFRELYYMFGFYWFCAIDFLELQNIYLIANEL
jgi:hypothetical protein